MDKEFEEQAFEEAMEYYVDSDEFLEEPWVKEIAAELDREKTMVLDVNRAKDVYTVWQLLGEIIKEEHLDGKLEYVTENIMLGSVRITMVVDEFGCVNSVLKRTKAKFIRILMLCDNFLVMPRVDDKLNIDFTFRGIAKEI